MQSKLIKSSEMENRNFGLYDVRSKKTGKVIDTIELGDYELKELEFLTPNFERLMNHDKDIIGISVYGHDASLNVVFTISYNIFEFEKAVEVFCVLSAKECICNLVLLGKNENYLIAQK